MYIQRTIYEKNYLIFDQITPNFISILIKNRRIQLSDQKINFTILAKSKESLIVSVNHSFVQNGDLIPDPEIIVKINAYRKFVEAFSFQDQFGFRSVQLEDGTIDIEARDEINQFLYKWLIQIKNEIKS